MNTAEKPASIDYINADYGVRSWLPTKDHKRIAVLYWLR
jgi:hypothetical protein